MVHTRCPAGVRGFPVPGGSLSLDLASLLGPLFLMWVLQLAMPSMVAQWLADRQGGHTGLLKRQGASTLALGPASWVW